jgi:hypothetical protein
MAMEPGRRDGQALSDLAADTDHDHDPHDEAEAVSTVHRGAGQHAAVLAASAERDRWLSRLLAAERDAYRRGWADGAASAAVAIAEIEGRRESAEHWRAWAARHTECDRDPDTRMARLLRQIAEDRALIRDAEAKQPWRRTYLETCVTRLRGVRLADPGDAA